MRTAALSFCSTALLAGSASAQLSWHNLEFPVGVSLTVVDYDQQPSLVVFWSPDYIGSWEFARFWYPRGSSTTVELGLRASGMIDFRACAPRSLPILSHSGDNSWIRWPEAMPANGFLLSRFRDEPRIGFVDNGLDAFTPWSLSYCDIACRSACPSSEAAPSYVALVFSVDVSRLR